MASDRPPPDLGSSRERDRPFRDWLRRASRSRPAVLACFADDLTPTDELLLRALLAEEDD
ncbi:MAG TPA: hypothetical protein VHX38_34375 [Pseudonocardiaceae bacterium]|nr:hypothetical protein [Pseudonocardiaceae bacterium]